MKNLTKLQNCYEIQRNFQKFLGISGDFIRFQEIPKDFDRILWILKN